MGTLEIPWLTITYDNGNAGYTVSGSSELPGSRVPGFGSRPRFPPAPPGFSKIGQFSSESLTKTKEI